MNNIQDLLDRGFGLLAINDLISLTYHDNIMEVHFAALPGQVDPTTIRLASRTERDIKHEIHDYFTQEITYYYDLISSDLITI